MKTMILFLENRSITDLWSGVAELLQDDFECCLLRFNHSYGKKFPGKIMDIDDTSKLGGFTDPAMDTFIQTVFQTDRASYLNGATKADIRSAVLSVFETLDQIKFDIVLGEVTSVYERAVEFYCRKKGLIFLAPMTARIPADRFFFLDGSALFPLPIATEPRENTHVFNAVNAAQRNAGKNDLAMAINRYVRLRNTLRTISGWIKGERLHTPSPLRKILLNWQRKSSLSQLANMPFASIKDIDKNSVIYCMHVQPESTLDTYSPDLWDQAKIVRQLAQDCSVAKRAFFVRTHPRGKHEISLHLAGIKASGAIILSPQISMHDILQCRSTIVTVSGTVMLEAATAGAITVALDCSYLSTFPGVLQVSLSEFNKFLAGDIAATPVKSETQSQWFELINKYSHKGLISPPEWSSDALSSQNLDDIAAGVRLAVQWAEGRVSAKA